jgi:hypothetical protein
VKGTPDRPDWIHEIKLDGYRTPARLDTGRAQILTRRVQHDHTTTHATSRAFKAPAAGTIGWCRSNQHAAQSRNSLQIGMVAAFKSEWVAAFKSEYPAGFIGIRGLALSDKKLRWPKAYMMP